MLNNKKALLIGASGLTGTVLLNLLLNNEHYVTVFILVRKKLSIEHPKLVQIVFNFITPQILDIQADDCFCTLGTTIKKAGSQAEFYKVDYTYVTEIAKAAFENGCKQFAVVSAMGANSNSSIFYNRVKGEMENTLKNIGFTFLGILQPSLLLGDRKEKRFFEKFAAFIMTSFSFLLPAAYKAIDVSQVAQKMVHIMNENLTGIHVFTSDKIRV